MSQLHCNSNSVYIFLFWELRGLSFSFHIHDLYIPRVGPHISSNRKGRPIVRSQTHECGNWDWGPGILFLGIFVPNSPGSPLWRDLIKVISILNWRFQNWHALAGNRSRASAVGGEHSRKELLEQLVKHFSSKNNSSPCWEIKKTAKTYKKRE